MPDSAVEKVIAKVNLELAQIDELFEIYADLLEDARLGNLKPRDLASLASVLHSFYNGVENIFSIFAKEIDQSSPNSAEWHTNLLKQMSQVQTHRPPVISGEFLDALSEYLSFRHFYRHAYSFRLRWGKMSHLVQNLPQVKEDLNTEVAAFLASLRLR